MDRERSVFNMTYNDSPWHRKTCPSEDSSVEEEIEDETLEEVQETMEEVQETGVQEFANKVEEEVEEDQEFVYSVDEDFEDLHDEEESEIKEMSDLDKTESEMEEILEFAAETESENEYILDFSDEKQSEINKIANFDETEYEMEVILEEVEEDIKEQTSISSNRENYRDTSFDETEDSERSERSDKSSGLQEALDEERKAKAALEEALMKEKTSTAQHKAALKHEQKEKDAFAKALKYEQYENNSLCDRIQIINADLKESQKELQHGKAKLKNRITIMTSELEEDKKVIEKLQIAQHASSSQHQREISELLVLNTASVTAIKDRLTERQEESLKKDKDIESLRSNVLNLQSDIVAKVSIVTSLQDRVNKCASDLKEEETKSSSLQRDYEAAASQQKKEAEELARLTQGNQHLAYENKRLQSELEAALNKQHIEEKKLQGDRGACSRLEEAIKKEGARFSRASKKIQSQEKELSEKTLALEGLQRDYEAAVSQQKKEAEELARLTRGNQHLAYENKRLQSELAALNKQHIEEKKLQSDRGACSRLEEAIKKEGARFSRASKKIQSQEKELSEMTLALEKSLTAEKLLKSSLKSEKKRFERMVGKQASAGHLSILTQLRDASAYDMQTLRMENADIRAKFLVLEREYDRERFELRSLSAGHEEMLSRKNDSISDNQFTITNLQCIVNDFKAEESKIKMRQADLEEALKQEKTRNSELHHTVDQISSGLEKERTRCEKHRVELQEALKKQITTLEENNKLTLSLQKAQEIFPRLQEKQCAETNYNFGNIIDSEFRLREQKYSLDESNKALYHLQQEYTNLGRRHCDINAEYRELLKTHTALQVRHERLSYAQGNPRPEFSPYLFQSNCTAH
ncbi:myosin heavy chain, fast skeletal muscle-like isoform X2 [Gymnodraco acuticeps]|uniref:Myosin heavy chain, fast skeletal muscle-like isoform X2 n=1 Tax=Gymnodraco acuticeps TaxID=8218 RepID=A0A6P8TPF1_GYMAC|nr:myosin heavy chain, fast skeletal muscle-like isoform X2 [Gymnodraco acuticeps]